MDNSDDVLEQENEITALSSILEEGVFHVVMDPIPHGNIVINLSLPLDSKSGYKIYQEFDNQDDCIFVNHLPPIKLHFTMPAKYPSAVPPNFTLQSGWMDRAAVSKLCMKLDEIWTDCQGMAILFQWYTFLKDDALSYVNISDGYRIMRKRTHAKSTDVAEDSEPKKVSSEKLGNKENEVESTSDQNPGPSTSAVCVEKRPVKPKKQRIRIQKSKKIHLDPRAVLDVPDNDLPLLSYLKAFSEEKDQETFNKEVKMCNVCFTEKFGKDFLRIIKCQHFVCKTCAKTAYTAYIEEGSIDNVRCLATQCSEIPPHAQLKTLLNENTFTRFDELLLRRALENMEDIIHCPRSSCSSAVIIDADDKLGSCTSCGYKFCTVCKATYHGVEPCKFKSDKKRKIYEEYINATDSEKKVLEKTYGKKQLEMLVQSTLSEEYIQKESKPCPHCSVPIEKYSGCNKVTCSKCGTYFCWTCCQQLDKSNPYYHYQDPSSNCFDQLFTQAERFEQGQLGNYDYSDGSTDDDDSLFELEEDFYYLSSGSDYYADFYDDYDDLSN